MFAGYKRLTAPSPYPSRREQFEIVRYNQAVPMFQAFDVEAFLIAAPMGASRSAHRSMRS